MLKKIQAAIFDLDDTLYPERQYVYSGYQSISRYLQEQRGRDDDFGGWLWRRFQAGQSANAFNALSEHFNLNFSDTDIRTLVEVYRNHKPQLEPRAGMVELLENLKRRDIKLGIISDGFLPAQQYKLDALGIARFFDKIIFTESLAEGHKCWKPSTIAFAMISDGLNAAPKHCCYIADNLKKDFIAPNQLGWTSIYLQTDDQIHISPAASELAAPKYTVNSVSELSNLL